VTVNDMLGAAATAKAIEAGMAIQFVLPVFGIIWWLDRRRGGYQPVPLESEAAS